MITGTTRIEVGFTLTHEERHGLRVMLYGKEGPIPEEDFQKWVREQILPKISDTLFRWRVPQ